MDIRNLLLILFGVFVDRVAGPIYGLVSQGFASLRARWYVDHETIRRTSLRNAHGGRESIYINIACAPSKAWNPPQRLPDSAEDVVSGHFGELFGAPTFFTPNELVRFEQVAAKGHAPTALLRIYPSGLIEFSRALNHQVEGEAISLDAVEITRRVADFATFIQQDGYVRLFQRRVAKID